MKNTLVGAPRSDLKTPNPPDWCANRAPLRSAGTSGLRHVDLHAGCRSRPLGRCRALNPTAAREARVVRAQPRRGGLRTIGPHYI